MMLKRGRVQDHSEPPSNPNATPEARLLLARLRNTFGTTAGSEAPMFMGVNEMGAATPYFQVNGDRIEQLVGKRALFSSPFAVKQGSLGYAEQVEKIKEHYRAGGMCGTIWHPNNILTGENNYDRDKSDYSAVTQCLSPSGSALAAYRAELDDFADMLNNDFVVDGVKIPLLIRTGGEANGWYDYPDMSVDSLTRSGTTATMHFSRGGNPITGTWAVGAKIQIRGASDPKWNQMHLVTGYVLDGDSNGATVTFQIATSPVSSPSGTITTYPSAGAWWAGADRAADLNLLTRQTIEYLRDVKGCNQLLWAPNLFTWNRIYLSSNPATHPYSLWLDGMENYYDYVSINIYQDEPVSWGYCDFGHQSILDGFQPFVDWCNEHGKPILIYEFGAKYDGATTGDFWSRRCMSVFDNTNFRRLAGVVFWSPTFLPTDGTLAVADFQQATSNPRYRWL